MEQTSYWMWTRGKLTERSHVQTSATCNDSWEEQAFAEDSSGPLGGCIWPPRSYSCSFCRREFRSAQALGGHMNVHRRDRARLKQSPSSNTEILQRHHIPMAYNPYKPNPNSNPSVIVESPLSPSRVSVPSTQDNCCEHNLVSPSYTSTIVQEHQKGSLLLPHQSSQFDSVSVKVLTVSDSNLEGDKNLKVQDRIIGAKEEYVKLDSSVSLNLVVSRKRLMGSGDDGESIRTKRRIDATSFPFYLKSSTVDIQHLQSEALGLSPITLEELDLELRLGNRPKVK